MPAILLTGFGPKYDPPENISISLHVNSNPANTFHYAQALGPYLEIYSAKLLDKEKVLVLPEQPLPSGMSTTTMMPSVPGPIGSQSPIKAIFSEESDLIESFSTKIEVEDELANGFVLPMNVQRLKKMAKGFGKLVPKMPNISLEPGEIMSWKQLLPVLVERCRTWTHLESCQYAVEGRIPLATEMETIPLCACGEGKDVQRMHNVALWKPLAKYCTRFALSPLFGVSYLETIGRMDRRCCVC
ncbi:hypothetical protein B0H11DRAFT_1284585 [Mycena galericulata]|nr:hypothetical protein B0H11DRAFT_1284585 [Mycena galericulata]